MKRFFTVLAVLALVALPAAAEKIYKLDAGVKLVAKELSAKLPEGTKVCIVEIKAEKAEASNYIVEQLTYELLQVDRLVVVDRQNLDAIRQELSLQTSGEVSDESAQRLGAMLGAEVLITGSFDLLTDKYRMALKAVKVETAEIRYLSTHSIESSDETEALFGRKTGAARAASVAGTAVKNVAGFTGRFICSVINPFFGLGSYMQGDMAGGGTVSGWEIVGGITFAVGSYRADNDLSNGQLFQTVGLGIIGVTVVYSWIRPWTYNRNPGLAEVVDNVTVSLTGENSLSFGYTVKY